MNTVFVIGAGASKEAGLPTGEELKKDISELLNLRWHHGMQVSGDSVIAEAISCSRKAGGKNKIYKETIMSACQISHALPLAISIDNFIDAHRDNKNIIFCSKLAIVSAILAAECKSLLYFKNDKGEASINFDALQDTWYLRFFRIITENCDYSRLKDRLDSVNLIIFNYDRCVEYFLFHAFINYYKISEADSSDLILHMNIYHPYGSVGELPWMSGTESLPFGSGLHFEKLLSLSGRIKTFTEGIDFYSSGIENIKSAMGNADRVAFIGFAFHPLNMELITPKEIMLLQWEPPKCFASTFDVSKSDQVIIQNQIRSIYGDEDLNVIMSDIKCNDFFKEFSKSLSFE